MFSNLEDETITWKSRPSAEQWPYGSAVLVQEGDWYQAVNCWVPDITKRFYSEKCSFALLRRGPIRDDREVQGRHDHNG